jgi:hypothetical protein
MTKQFTIDLPTLVGLLNEAKEWVTDKPWDDDTHLHKRICEALNQPIEYPNWNYDETYRPRHRDQY